jgi:hypothetical protein
MLNTRQIRGEFVFPHNASSGVAARATIALCDVSNGTQTVHANGIMQNLRIVVSKIISDVPVGPRERVRFTLDAPDFDKHRHLEMRILVDMQTTQRQVSGDYLTTVSTPVAPAGDVQGVVVPLTRLL